MVAIGSFRRRFSRASNQSWALWSVRTVGLFSVLYALLDIRDDVFGAPAGAVTDATMLAQHTGVPSLVWGVVWGLVGLALLYKLRKALV